MNSNFLKFTLYQFGWMISYAMLLYFFYSGNISTAPEYSKSIFLITFIISLFFMLGVDETDEGLKKIRGVKTLFVGSIILLFLLNVLVPILTKF